MIKSETEKHIFNQNLSGQNIQPSVNRKQTKMSLKLPKGFEKTIIELEFQIEKGIITQELITMVLSLY